MTSPKKTPPYAVGYGKPPTDKQFKKGRSGNPKGRPQGAKNLGFYARKELGEMIEVTLNGETMRIPKAALIMKAHVAKAAKGDPRSADYVLKAEQRGEASESLEPKAQPLSEDDDMILERYFAARLRAAGGESDDTK